MPTTLISGANRGLGLEMVKQYAADGWRVHACCRSPATAVALRKIAAGAANVGERIHVHRLDVADFSSIDQLAWEMKDEAIDLLVNNAGIYTDKDAAFGAIDYARWSEAFRINTLAPLRMAESFIEHVARGEKKIIATVTSRMGSIGDNTSGGSYGYRSTKAAVNAAVRSLAIDLQSRGVIAVVIHPGWVRTEMGGPRAPLGPEESVAGMRSVLARLTPADSGRFLSHDGTEIPW